MNFAYKHNPYSNTAITKSTWKHRYVHRSQQDYTSSSESNYLYVPMFSPLASLPKLCCLKTMTNNFLWLPLECIQALQSYED